MILIWLEVSTLFDGIWKLRPPARRPPQQPRKGFAWLAWLALALLGLACPAWLGLAYLGSAWLVSSTAATTTATTPEEAAPTTAVARSATPVVITASSGVVVAAVDETSQAEPR